jgi:antitoxin (DNA-binding transcriptional repressor) of toxin-antitoxin stability system
MSVVSIEEAQAKLPELIAGLQPGKAVEITLGDRTVARLVVDAPASRLAQQPSGAAERAAGPEDVEGPCDRGGQETFVLRAQRLDRRGRTDAALDLIYDQVDESMHRAQFDRLDSILANLPVADLSMDILLGILTATLPATRRLGSRAKLFQKIEQVLRNRGDYEEGLLVGLEGSSGT